MGPINHSIGAAFALGALNVTAETSRTVLPSATGFAARQAIALARARDVPIAALLNRAGVSESDIDSHQRRIAAMAQGKLLEYAAETLKRQRIWIAPCPEGEPTRSGVAVLCRLRR
jgi:hypothetical protein